MPTYEYQCQACQSRMEFFQSIKEQPKTECPLCHGELKRLVSSGAGVIFKGSGFYETDYKKKEPEKKHTHHVSHTNGENTEPKNGTATAPAETKPESAGKTENSAAEKEKAA